MKSKIFIKIIILLLLIIFLTVGNVNAVYESNQYTYSNPMSQNWDTWLNSIRAMEATNGSMGLTETLNGTTATSSSNNIDVHMAKATEYGAVAILSASRYGNPNNTQKPKTSTSDGDEANKTGIYYNYGNWEFTACIAAQEVGSSFSKYWDKYNTLNLRGLSPSSSWHGGSAGSGLDTSYTYNRRGGPTVWPNFYYVVERDSPIGYARTVLSTGYNGIFTYNWGARKEGYTKGGAASGYNYNDTGQWYYIAASYNASTFYSRGAAVNMQGI